MVLEYDCSTAFTAPAEYSKVIPYDPNFTTNPTLIDVTWDVFFDNTDPTYCLVDYCYYSEVGNCGNWNFQFNTDVFENTNSWPYTMDADPSNPNGWEYHFCLTCYVYDIPYGTGYWSFEVDNVMFKQIKDCSTTISPGMATDKSYPYAAGGSPQ